jgi:hypothetical protein
MIRHGLFVNRISSGEHVHKPGQRPSSPVAIKHGKQWSLIHDAGEFEKRCNSNPDLRLCGMRGVSLSVESARARIGRPLNPPERRRRCPSTLPARCVWLRCRCRRCRLSGRSVGLLWRWPARRHWLELLCRLPLCRHWFGLLVGFIITPMRQGLLRSWPLVPLMTGAQRMDYTPGSLSNRALVDRWN